MARFDFVDDIWRAVGECLQRLPLGVVLDNRYRILDQIAEGGMGAVYVAADMSLPGTPQRAVKIVRLDCSTPELAARLRQEAGILSELIGVAEGLLDVHAVGEHEGQPYIVTEYVRGTRVSGIHVRDLETYLRHRNGRLKPRAAAEIVYRCSVALDAVHRHQAEGRHPIVHRDVKPSNVLLATDEGDALGFRIKLADFGLAARVDEKSEISGTPGYMAPEQAIENVEVTPAADIWALGIMLFQLISGELPLKLTGTTARERVDSFRQQIETLVAQGRPIPIPRIGDPDITAICRRCLEIDPQRRYQAAGTPLGTHKEGESEPHRRQRSELTEALDRWLAHKPLQPPHGSTGLFRRTSLFIRRNAVATVATMMFLVTALAAAWIGKSNLNLDAANAKLNAANQNTTDALNDVRALNQKQPEQLGRMWLERGVRELEEKRYERGWAMLAEAARNLPPDSPLHRAIEDHAADASQPLLRSFPVGNDVQSIAFSPDGSRVVMGHANGSASLQAIDSGLQIGSRVNGDVRVWAVAFSPDGSCFATGGADGMIRLWGSETTKEIGNGWKYSEEVTFLAFSSDGRHILTPGENNSIRLWDVNSGDLIEDAWIHPDPIHNLVVSPDGRHFATACFDDRVRLWDIHSGNSEQVINVPSLNSIAISPDGRIIVSGGGDGFARMWNCDTGDQLREWNCNAPVTSVRFSPDGRRVVASTSYSWDTTVHVWNVNTNLPELEPLVHPDWVLTVAFSPDGSRIMTTCGDGFARLWDVDSCGIGAPLDHGDRFINDMAISASGRRVVTACPDGSVCLWEVESSKQVREPWQHPDTVHTVAFSADELHVITGCEDGFVRWWHVDRDEPVREPWKCPGGVRAVAVSSNGQYVIAGGGSDGAGYAWLWDVHSQQHYPIEFDFGDTVRAVTFSCDSRQIATACYDGYLRLWDVDEKAQIGQPLNHPGEMLLTVGISHNSQQVLLGGMDRQLRIWDIVTGKQIGQSLRHSSAILDAAFNHNSRLVLTGSNNWRLWQVETGLPIGVSRRHIDIKGSDRVGAAAFTSNGFCVVTAGAHTVRKWLTRRPFHVLLTEAIGGHIVDNGVVRAMSNDEFAKCWHLLKADEAWPTSNEEFERLRCVGTHQRIAAEAELEGDWFAAEFHLQRLLAADAESPELLQRLANAKAKRAQ